MLAGREWAVIRKDNRSIKRRRPAEFAAFTEAGLGVFVLRAAPQVGASTGSSPAISSRVRSIA